MATNTTPTDPVPLSKLRPGMPLATLIAAYGENWPQKPQSNTFFFDEPMGFLVHIDVDGVIGAVTFAKSFPLPVEIGGLKRGMSMAQALAARPDLTDAGVAPRSAVRLLRLMLPDGVQFEGRFLEDQMIAMELSRPGAVYERKLSYPPAAGKPGAPFADPNFKLVVLDALASSGAIQLGPRDRLARHLLDPSYNEARDGYDLLKPVYAYLVRYPLVVADLAAVEELVFDGGNDIYAYAFPFWDGETDAFDVYSLEGIELLANLRRIEVISLLLDTDLSRLSGLQQLEHVGLGHGPYQNGDSLLQLPKLKTVSCGRDAFSDPSLVPTLGARGVSVRLF
ncbi:hypothetical protein SAMN05444159_1559 [Bradyrhizobium lablabi]|uniref:Uncharacterized protein n=1 Tax=Bradyrhizobium lablabi TaxID=722472 RepID=A0A1M6MBW0_9BRAD|nr:hypothetical protein [Bradyrhizobium lablabi]SHJ80934.1 hypothetical protein SAMN05444159_1559 [Bradyrhizobium lablabi]